MMRIVQSYNGRIDDKVEVTRWMTALSVIYLNRLGLRPVLYTNRQGRKNLGRILDYYAEVHELKIPRWVDGRFFAAAKFFAMQHEPLGTIHIDNDVLLKTPRLIDRISSLCASTDVVVQGIERYVDKPYDDCIAEYTAAGYRFGLDINHNTPINTGLICLTNEALREAYYTQYFDAVRHMSRWLRCTTKRVYPDYIPEQAALYTLCKENNYRIGEIIDAPTIDECNIQADAIGYAHFWGGSKIANLPLIQSRVRELSGR